MLLAKINAYQRNIPVDQMTPPEFKNDEPREEQCDFCFDYSDSFKMYRGFCFCPECINNQEGETMDEMIRYHEKSKTKELLMIRKVNKPKYENILSY